MHLFIRRTLAQVLTAGALSVGFVGTGLAMSPALALTPEQISRQRSTVLAYVLENDEGLILYPGVDAAADELNLLVFMSEEEAQNFLADSAESAPSDVRIILTNLERIHQVVAASGENQPRLVLVPEPAEVEEAVELNAGYQGGVPLFFAQLEDGSFAPLRQDNGDAVFPMFFSRADLEEALSGLAETDPEAREAISIGVLPLQTVLQEIQTSDDELLSQIRLLPPEVVDAIRSQEGAPQQQQPAAQPEAPAAPAEE
ncbi:MAG: Tic22 family protein [Cyanobacteria bacterium J06614_10]